MDTSMETTEKSKPVSVRKIFQKNERERKSCDMRTKVIDLERKVTCARLSREEREVKTQLERLESERKQKVKDDDTDYLNRYFADTLDFEDAPDHTSDLHLCVDQEMVTNPYPVTIGRARKNSVPSIAGRMSPSCLSALHSRECLEFEDLASPNGKLLPPILTHSRGNLVSLKGEHSIIRKSSSGSCLNPQHLGDSKVGESCGADLWVGDPQAISSVRRNRKSPAQQRLERSEKNAHRWARSRSLKEGANLQRRDIKTSLSRSHSMKEQNPSNLVRRRSISRCSTAVSRTSSIGKTSSECSLDEDHVGKVKNRLPQNRDDVEGKSMMKSNSLSQVALLGTSPDCRQQVWGWIESINTKSLTEEVTEVVVLRKSHARDDGGLCEGIERGEGQTHETHRLVRRFSEKRRHKPTSLQSAVSRGKGNTAIKPDSSTPSPGGSPRQKEPEKYPQTTTSSPHLSVATCFEILAATSSQDK